MENKKWYAFMATDRFVVFINIIRIISLIGIFLLILIMVRNIEEVKILGSDPCKICAIEYAKKDVICSTMYSTKTYLENGTIDIKNYNTIGSNKIDLKDLNISFES